MSIDLHVSINCSWRYFVVGGYKDRDKPIVRFYLPFVRLSVERVHAAN